MTFRDRARALFGMSPRSVQFSSDSTPVSWDVAVMRAEQLVGGKVSRLDALSVAAIKRGRDIICGIANWPLDTIDQFRVVVPETLLTQIDPNVPDFVTIAQTLEDLLFDAQSWWLITEMQGPWPIHARHLNYTQVQVNPRVGNVPAPLPSGIDPRGEVRVDGKLVNPDFLIRFDSLNTPLLRDGARTVRRALVLDKVAEQYANNPRPAAFIAPTDSQQDAFASAEDAREALNSLRIASRQGDTIYIPGAVQYNTVQQPTPVELQLVPQQQRAALDIANLIGLDPEDLGISTTSRTYQNAVERRQDRINDVMLSYANAVTGRLSMNDITPDGYKVRFKTDNYLTPDPKTRWENYEIATRLGAISPDEIRAAEGMPELTPAQRRQIDAIKVQATVGNPVKEIGGGGNGAA